jgi:hypothetical protein
MAFFRKSKTPLADLKQRRDQFAASLNTAHGPVETARRLLSEALVEGARTTTRPLCGQGHSLNAEADFVQLAQAGLVDRQPGERRVLFWN